MTVIGLITAIMGISVPIVIAVIILKKSRDKAEIREARNNPGEGKKCKTRSER